jgi:putative peptidoglycan lipid II flippase
VVLPAFAGVKLIVPAFYSQQDTRTPVAAAAAALALNIVLNVMFLWLFFVKLGNGTPALATSLAAYLNFFLLFYILRGRVGRLGGRRVAVSLGKVALGSAAMALVCHALLHGMAAAWGGTLIHRTLALSVTMGAGVAVFMGISWLLRCEEIHELLDMLRQRGPEPETGMAVGG